MLSDFEQRLAYDQQADAWHRPLATELVQYASLSVGQSVLDVATGSGPGLCWLETLLKLNTCADTTSSGLNPLS